MKQCVTNKKARFNYEILETIEAGIELVGHEVKSISNHQGSLDGSYISIRNGELWLIGSEIPAYQQKNTPTSYLPQRQRKLLVHKKQVKGILKESEVKGQSIIPLSLYTKGTKIKVEIAVARGKKRFDKRETIKKRDSDREIHRTIKGGR
jgi:SsrA-binding protein